VPVPRGLAHREGHHRAGWRASRTQASRGILSVTLFPYVDGEGFKEDDSALVVDAALTFCLNARGVGGLKDPSPVFP